MGRYKAHRQALHLVQTFTKVSNISVSVQNLHALTLALIVMASAGPVRAADDAASTPSAEEVAAMLANPNATLGFLAFNIDHVQYAGKAPGADDQSAPRLAFQPSLPYPLNESTNSGHHRECLA